MCHVGLLLLVFVPVGVFVGVDFFLHQLLMFDFASMIFVTLDLPFCK